MSKRLRISRARSLRARRKRRKTFIGGRFQQQARMRKRNVRTAGFLGIELKFYDTSLAGLAIPAPADATGGELDPSTTILFNSVVQGDGESQRDGRQISMRSIGIKGLINVNVQANQTVADVAPIVFLALVLDTQTNGATIASENVYVNKSGNAMLAAHPFRNLQFSKRFQVLKTLTLSLEQPEMTYDGTNIEQGGYDTPFQMFVNLDGITVNYSGTTETVANITDNSLHLIGYASGVTTVPLIYYNARLRFVG